MTKPEKQPRFPKTRCGGKWTEARYRSFIRSALRKLSMRWPPMRAAKLKARRPYVGPNNRQKFESQCVQCKGWFKESETQADHIVPCGSMIDPAALWEFVERVLCEEDGFQVLCKTCHHRKTHAKTEDDE